MKLSKFFLIAGALSAGLYSFGAEELRQRRIGNLLEYGLEARTGYDSNIYANASETGSFVLTLRPYLRFEQETAKTKLKLAYKPEYRWYENRDETKDSDFDQNFEGMFELELSPTMVLTVEDRFSMIEGNDVSEVGDTTTGGDNEIDNDFDRNIFTTALDWEFERNNFFNVSYTNYYLDYDDQDNEYRNLRSNALTLSYKRQTARDLKLGVLYTFKKENFVDSDYVDGGLDISRDTNLHRIAASADWDISGPLNLTLDLGVDRREVVDDVVAGVDDSFTTPYLSAKLTYKMPRKQKLVAGAVMRSVTGSKADAYIAEQQRVFLDYVRKMNERLEFTAGTSYENNYYDKEHSLSGTFGNDHEEWFNLYGRVTYTVQQNLDVVCGINHRRKYNTTEGGSKYTINKYDLGLIYKF